MKPQSLLRPLLAGIVFGLMIHAPASAQTTGQIGENISYVLDDNGVLTVSGTGKIPNDIGQGYSRLPYTGVGQ